MCGVAGASLSPESKTNAKRIAKAMLLSIESRGRDATGFAYLDKTGAFQVHKKDVDASTFVKRRLCLPKGAKTFIMHTRFATQGAPEVNDNNHPIATGTVVGVHNGHISNDWEIFQSVNKLVNGDVRIADVDSEAAFALLGWVDDDTTALLEEIEGGATLAWMDNTDEQNILHLARLNSSPLVIGETEDGSILFASTADAIKDGAAAGNLVLNKIRYIDEGNYITVLDGAFVNVRTFKPKKSYTSYRRSGGTTYYTSGHNNGRHIPGLIDWDEYEDIYHVGSASAKRFDKDRSTDGPHLIGLPGGAASSLDSRLAAEEPEAFDAYDDDARYAEWLERNGMEVEAAVIRDDVRHDRQREKFDRYCNAPKLNSYLLSDAEYLIRVPGESEYLAENSDREWEIESWLNSLKANDHNKALAAKNMKFDARPGALCTTDLNGQPVVGHLIALPTDIFQGDYMLRCYIENPKRKHKFEAIFVARRYFEFEMSREPLNNSEHTDKELQELDR